MLLSFPSAPIWSLLKSRGLAVEVMEKETVDTSVLSSVKMSKEEALSLLSKEQVLTGRNKRGEDR